MSKSVSVFVDKDIKWPKYCALCGSKRNITGAKAYVDLPHSHIPAITFGWHVSGKFLSLNYPVCQRHYLFAQIAGRLNRNSNIVNLLRNFSYILTLVGLIHFILIELGQASLTILSEPSFLCLFVASFISTSLIAYCKLLAPLRLSNWDDGNVDILFCNGLYAKKFAAHNPEQTAPLLNTQSPWYSTKLLSRNLLVLCCITLSLASLVQHF